MDKGQQVSSLIMPMV